MTTTRCSWWWSMVGLPLAVLVGGCSAAQEPEGPQDPAVAARCGRLRAAGLPAPLTIHPVQVLGRPSPRVAQAVGLVLEKQGMPDLDVAATSFEVAADGRWEDVPAQFGAHVRALVAAGAAARHHLYAQYLGTPQTGPQEVRFCVVDGAGDVVLVDRQTPADAAFRRTAGRDPDPMGCSLLVAERLFARVGWRAQAGAVQDGRFARLWRELSGAPEAREFEAMAPRLAALRRNIANARFAVLPSVVHPGHDAASSERLAALLAQRFGCRAQAVAGGAAIAVAADSNEQKRLWDLARGLRAAAPAAAEAAGADHVLVVDVGIGDRGIGYVHVAVCTAAGDYVVVDWQNDQHPMLQKAAPKVLDDAERFAVDRLAALLR
ncbi:MAG: hypothetical protein KF830_16485 [Planctomycetes bacterium]|nr:hypothetical protein [Planctomycetota bacterium]